MEATLVLEGPDASLNAVQAGPARDCLNVACHNTATCVILLGSADSVAASVKVNMTPHTLLTSRCPCCRRLEKMLACRCCRRRGGVVRRRHDTVVGCWRHDTVGCWRRHDTVGCWQRHDTVGCWRQRGRCCRLLQHSELTERVPNGKVTRLRPLSDRQSFIGNLLAS